MTTKPKSLLHAKVERVIFMAMMPNHMTLHDWDSNTILGENNSYRKKIEMAASLAIIEVKSV